MLFHHLLNSCITLTVFQGGQRTSSMKVVIDMGSNNSVTSQSAPSFLGLILVVTGMQLVL